MYRPEPQTPAEQKAAEQRAKEMHDCDAPYPKTEGELIGYIQELLNQEHDYNTSVYAASLATVATYNYMMRQIDGTVFQASCADLDFLRRVRRINGPFMLITAEKALYPQYDTLKEVQRFLDECGPWLAEQANEKLEHNMDPAQRENHPNVDFSYVAPVVWKHWQKLAKGKP